MTASHRTVEAEWALSGQGVSAWRAGVQVLHGLDWRIRRGAWTCLLGPNGAGKSTWLSVMAGLHPATGALQLFGVPLADWPKKKRAQHIAWLSQTATTGDGLSAYEVVMLGRLPHRTWLTPPSEQDRQAVRQAMQLTQCWAWRATDINQLSGGERQRVLLARALAVQAKVLLMDEPLTALDPAHQSEWLSLIQQLVRRGHTVVTVLHDISSALHSDDVVLLQRGRIVHQGSSQAPATHQALQAVFQQRLKIIQAEGQWLCLPKILTSDTGTQRPASP